MSATTADDGHADDTGPDYYKAMAYAPWEAMQAILTPEEWRGYLKGISSSTLCARAANWARQTTPTRRGITPGNSLKS